MPRNVARGARGPAFAKAFTFVKDFGGHDGGQAARPPGGAARERCSACIMPKLAESMVPPKIGRRAALEHRRRELKGSFRVTESKEAALREYFSPGTAMLASTGTVWSEKAVAKLPDRFRRPPTHRPGPDYVGQASFSCTGRRSACPM